MADDANISGRPEKDPDDWVTGEAQTGRGSGSQG